MAVFGEEQSHDAPTRNRCFASIPDSSGYVAEAQKRTSVGKPDRPKTPAPLRAEESESRRSLITFSHLGSVSFTGRLFGGCR